MVINILLVEDQKLIRVGLKSLFDGQNEMQVNLEAETAKMPLKNSGCTNLMLF